MSEFPEILTMEQAAEMLQVSVRTLQRMVKDGRMPGRQVGSQWRFDRDQLRQWVRGEVEAEPQPAEPMTQLELLEKERSRFGLDVPETLVELQQAAARRLADQEAAHHADQEDDA